MAMKKILLVSMILLLSTVCFGQIGGGVGLRLGKPLYTHASSGVTPIVYEAETIALFARMDVQPSDATKGYYNTFIKGLKDNSIWNKFLVIVPTIGETEQQSLLNIISTNFNPTINDVVNFTPKSGFNVTYDDTVNYVSSGDISANFTPSTNGGTLFTRNSCLFGVALSYILSSGSEHFMMGCGASCNFYFQVQWSGITSLNINDYDLSNYTSKGYDGSIFTFQRKGGILNHRFVYENNEAPTNQFASSAALASSPIYLFDHSRNHQGDAQLRAYWIGGEMTDAQVVLFSNLLNSFLTSMSSLPTSNVILMEDDNKILTEDNSFILLEK
jgi:hypothetical protein